MEALVIVCFVFAVWGTVAYLRADAKYESARRMHTEITALMQRQRLRGTRGKA